MDGGRDVLGILHDRGCDRRNGLKRISGFDRRCPWVNLGVTVLHPGDPSSDGWASYARAGSA
jgi:hypothetical protein